MMDEQARLKRIAMNPQIFGVKPIVRSRRRAVEQVLGILAARGMAETIIQGYPWLEKKDIQGCLAYADTARGNHEY